MDLKNNFKIENYDFTILVRGDASSEEISSLLRNILAVSSDNKIKFKKADYTGLIQSAYPIKKANSFHLYSINLEIDIDLIPYLDQKLKLMDLLSRYIILKIEDSFKGKFLLSDFQKDGVSRIIANNQKYKDILREFVQVEQI